MSTEPEVPNDTITLLRNKVLLAKKWGFFQIFVSPDEIELLVNRVASLEHDLRESRKA